jgi:hypothetical protein
MKRQAKIRELTIDPNDFSYYSSARDFAKLLGMAEIAAFMVRTSWVT